MTTADDARPAGSARYPWHDEAPVVPAASVRSGIQGRRAGFVTRSLANVVDVVVVVLLLAGGYVAVACAQFLLRPAAFTFPTVDLRLLLLLGLGLQTLYFAITWAVVGGTYGDRLLGLRVVGRRRARLGWGRSVVRAAFCTLFPIGLLRVLVSRENRSVQDVVLRTSVVYDWAPG
jgi:uncharacterized RDD family membrane protein YckC